MSAAEFNFWELVQETEHLLYKDDAGGSSTNKPRRLSEPFRDLLDSLCNEDRQAVLDAFKTVSKTGEICELEFRRVDQQGEIEETAFSIDLQ